MVHGGLEEIVEDCPQGSHEQEDDANGVADTARFGKRGTESSVVHDVLNQEVPADDQGDDIRPQASSVVNEHSRCGHDQEDEGSWQLQIP